MSIGSSFGGAVKWNFIGSAARVVLTLCCQLVLLRLLGPTIAGHFAIFLTIVGFGTVLSEGGMLAAITRAPSINEDTIRNALFLVLCYAGGVALLLLFCSSLLSSLFHLSGSERYLPIAAVLNIVPLGLSSVPLSLLRREYRARDVQFIQTSAYALGFAAFAIPAAFSWQSVWVMVGAFTTQSVVTLVGAIFLTRCPLVPSMRGASTMQRTTWRALASNIAFYFSESVAGVLTAQMVGARALGLYGTTLNLLRMPTDVLVNALHAPLLVSASSEAEGDATRIRFLTTLNVLATTAFAVLVTIYLTGSNLVVPLLGPKWQEAGPVLSVAAIVMMVRLLSMLSGAVVWGSGRLLADFCAQTISFFVVIGGFVLIHPDSAQVVAWIVCVSVAVRMLIQFSVAVHACSINTRMLWRSLILPLILTSMVMLPIAWISPLLLPHYGVVGFVGVGAAAATLLVIRIALGMWLTPDAWTRSLLARLPVPSGNRRSIKSNLTSRKGAPPESTVMPTNELS